MPTQVALKYRFVQLETGMYPVWQRCVVQVETLFLKYSVVKLPMIIAIMIHCHKRGDAWGSEVATIIDDCIAPVAAGDRYQCSCYR